MRGVVIPPSGPISRNKNTRHQHSCPTVSDSASRERPHLRDVGSGRIRGSRFSRRKQLFFCFSYLTHYLVCKSSLLIVRTKTFSPFGSFGYSEFPAYSQIISDFRRRDRLIGVPLLLAPVFYLGVNILILKTLRRPRGRA